MARKNVHSYAALSLVNATTAQDNSSNPTDISQVDKCSIHCSFSAPNAGDFHIFVRNSKNDAFFELDFGVTLTLAGESECAIDLQDLNFSDLYISWVPTIGAGTLTAILHMSSVGA
jgi:hypothetical protein